MGCLWGRANSLIVVVLELQLGAQHAGSCSTNLWSTAPTAPLFQMARPVFSRGLPSCFTWLAQLFHMACLVAAWTCPVVSYGSLNCFICLRADRLLLSSIAIGSSVSIGCCARSLLAFQVSHQCQSSPPKVTTAFARSARALHPCFLPPFPTHPRLLPTIVRLSHSSPMPNSFPPRIPSVPLTPHLASHSLPPIHLLAVTSINLLRTTHPVLFPSLLSTHSQVNQSLTQLSPSPRLKPYTTTSAPVHNRRPLHCLSPGVAPTLAPTFMCMQCHIVAYVSPTRATWLAPWFHWARPFDMARLIV